LENLLLRIRAIAYCHSLHIPHFSFLMFLLYSRAITLILFEQIGRTVHP